jgi:hypothetical protein
MRPWRKKRTRTLYLHVSYLTLMTMHKTDFLRSDPNAGLCLDTDYINNVENPPRPSTPERETSASQELEL